MKITIKAELDVEQCCSGFNRCPHMTGSHVMSEIWERVNNVRLYVDKLDYDVASVPLKIRTIKITDDRGRKFTQENYEG
jgi:hypothetical protein